MNERRFDDSASRMTREIENRYRLDDNQHSGLHDELHKLKSFSVQGAPLELQSNRFNERIGMLNSRQFGQNSFEVPPYEYPANGSYAPPRRLYPRNDYASPAEQFDSRMRRPERDFFRGPVTEGDFQSLRLQNRASNHGGADALVYVRKDFDPSKPVHLTVYNHGFGSTVSSALQRDQIKQMMSKAEPNTVLLLPEWQANPGSRNGNSGALAQQNKYTYMMQEAMQKTPALQGATLKNVDRIDIIAFSAGYSPTESEIYKNPALASKVRSITLLDSLYNGHGFDRWLKDNIHDLSTGKKQFYNFSNSTTMANSKSQARYVNALLQANRLPTDNYVADYGGGRDQVERHRREMAGRSIVFASTSVGHMQIPGQYMGGTLEALDQRKRNQRYRTPRNSDVI